MWSRSTRAASTICIATNATTMCGSFSRRKQQIAFYGGDPDNFEYPRFDLDICIFRAYENGQPAKIEHFLKWNTKGPSDGELTFVSGHPGRTDRQLTDRANSPKRATTRCRTLLNMFNRREVFLHAFGAAQFRKRAARAGRSLRHAEQPQTLRRLPGRACSIRKSGMRSKSAKQKLRGRDEWQTRS